MIQQIEPTMLEHGFIALVVLAGLYAVFRGQPAAKSIEWDTPKRIGMYISNGLVLMLVGGVTLGVWALAGRPLADIGLRLGVASPAGIGLALLFIVIFGLESRYRLSPKRIAQSIADWKRDTPFMPTNGKEFSYSLFLALNAGIHEEILFRGFLIPYIMSFTGSTVAGQAAAVTIPAVGFALAHLYQSWRSVGLIFVLSLMFGGIYLLTGSLLIPMVLHVLLDISSIWLGWRVLASTEKQPIVDAASAESI